MPCSQSRATATMTAAPVVVHLYTALLEGIHDESTRSRCESLLSPDELICRDRFVLERSRLEYVYSHALVRIALSLHAPCVAPDAWQFAKELHGKPRVSAPAGAPQMYFNLSHTNGLVACVVADTPLIGVDVEEIKSIDDFLQVAQRHFAPQEVYALQRAPPAEQCHIFFRLWTLKESYLKARGLGLTLPLDQFWFVSSQHNSFTLEVGKRAEARATWRFAERQPAPQHQLAVAVGNELDEDWSIDLVETHIEAPTFFRRAGV